MRAAAVIGLLVLLVAPLSPARAAGPFSNWSAVVVAGGRRWRFAVAQGRIVAHAFQAQAADGLDLVFRLDLEMAQGERMLEPVQVQEDVKADAKLIDADAGRVGHRWRRA